MSAATVEIPLKISFENRPLTATAAIQSSAARSIKGACAVNLTSNEGFLAARPPLVPVTNPKGTMSSLYSPSPLEIYLVTQAGAVWYANGTPGIYTSLGSVAVFSTYKWAASPLPLNAVLNHGGGVGYYRNGGAMTAIVDANFTSINALPYVVCLDGTYYITDASGAIYGSNLNDGSTWSALNRINAWQDNGLTICLIKHRSFVCALKQNSMQAFMDAGNPVGSPLLPVLQAQQPVGCVNGETVVEIRGDHFWVALSADDSIFVAQMSNLQISVVSTPAVDRWLEWAAKQGTLQGTKFSAWGKSYYAITFSAILGGIIAGALVYDVSEKEWEFWEGSVLAQLTQATYCMGFTDISKSETYYLASGSLFKFTDLPYLDGTLNMKPVVWGDQATVGGATSGIQAQFTSKIVDGGTMNEKTAMRLNVFSDNTFGGTLEVCWSDDDYRTWSGYVPISLTSPRAFINDLGTFRRRAFRFRHIGQTPLRIERISLDVLVGSN